MKNNATAQLRNLDTLYARLRDFAPANAVETEAQELLITLVKSRRSELRREFIKARIRSKGRVA